MMAYSLAALVVSSFMACTLWAFGKKWHFAAFVALMMSIQFWGLR